MIHIGISGPIASGKSTLAKSLRQLSIESGLACEIIPFAYGVREVAALEEYSDIDRRARITNLLYSWGYDYRLSLKAAELTDEYMRRYPSTPGKKNRRLLQSIGTEVGRMTVDENIWIHRIQLLFRRDLDFVISDDLRFDNEAMAVDVHVAIEVRTEEEKKLYQQRVQQFHPDYVWSNHPSEQGLYSPPLFILPIGFTQLHVLTLFDKLDRIRKLRA